MSVKITGPFRIDIWRASPTLVRANLTGLGHTRTPSGKRVTFPHVLWSGESKSVVDLNGIAQSQKALITAEYASEVPA